MRIYRPLASALAVLDVARAGARSQLREAINSPRLWAWDIARYERADRREPPPRGAILFTGSSTIRRWKTLARDMAPLPVVNRGFGGSQLAHVTVYAPRIVLPYEPAAIVLYSGDNDLDAWTGKTAATVGRDFDRFVSRVRRELPETPIYFVSIKPSRLRRAQWPEQQRVNECIAKRAAGDPTLEYVDIATPMLAGREVPGRELFTRDGLHLSAEGYRVWADVLQPRLMHGFEPLAEAALGSTASRVNCASKVLPGLPSSQQGTS